MKKILVSIITVVYNCEKTVGQTIQSVINANLDQHEHEHILIDGASTDRTVDIVKSYEDVVWISETDKGIYDAMNKGINMAKGTYVLFLNSGDLLFTIPFDTLKNDSHSEIICFPVKLSNERLFKPTVNKGLIIRNLLPHQGCFYRNKKGLQYDLKFKIFSDFHLNQSIYKRGGVITTHSQPTVAFHDVNGISHAKSSFQEIFKVVNSNFGILAMCVSYIYFRGLGLINRIKRL